MKAIGIIPARYGSTRFPGKPLELLGNYPIVVWCYLRSCQSKTLDKVVVATDDERIAQVIRKIGGQVVVTKKECPNGTMRCAEALKILEATGENWDLVVNIQGDEPLVDSEHLDLLVNGLKKTSMLMGALATPIQSETEWRSSATTKVVMNQDSQALYFSRAPIPSSKDGGYHPDTVDYYRNCGLYVFQRKFLDKFVSGSMGKLQAEEDLEQLKTLEMGYQIQMQIVDRTEPGVDLPEQLIELNNRLERGKFDELSL